MKHSKNCIMLSIFGLSIAAQAHGTTPGLFDGQLKPMVTEIDQWITRYGESEAKNPATAQEELVSAKNAFGTAIRTFITTALALTSMTGHAAEELPAQATLTSLLMNIDSTLSAQEAEFLGAFAVASAGTDQTFAEFVRTKYQASIRQAQKEKARLERQAQEARARQEQEEQTRREQAAQLQTERERRERETRDLEERLAAERFQRDMEKTRRQLDEYHAARQRESDRVTAEGNRDDAYWECMRTSGNRLCTR